MIVKCSECGAESPDKDKYMTEMWFDNHCREKHEKPEEAIHDAWKKLNTIRLDWINIRIEEMEKKNGKMDNRTFDHIDDFVDVWADDAYWHSLSKRLRVAANLE